MQVKFISSVREIGELQWVQLQTKNSPFLNYAFFCALEETDCIGERLGWLPQYLLIEDDDNILAFMPLFQKTNSYGELVFDWSWAEAYQRFGLPYYPKLVAAIPYTPVAGNRIIFNKDLTDKLALYPIIIDSLKNKLDTDDFSSFHCLFPCEAEMDVWNAHGFIRRLGCQFHWHNKAYLSFDHYLEHFSSRKRKNIKKERKQVQDQRFTFKMLKGNEIESDLWPVIYALYQVTFRKKGGIATFSQAFFETIARLMPENFLVNLVIYRGQIVACAILYRDEKTLYGRHWGCFEEFNNLHFETCYYQGLEYAIQEKLQVFEPGAQGEHKVSRGFLPVKTWSAHWIKDLTFRRAIADFALKEEDHMNNYFQEMQLMSPFK